MAGCTNPAAANYDPSQTEDDGSCVYINKIGENCYAFKDINIEDTVDNSFTLSWAIEGDNWVFYHDYLPDFYIHTREKLFSLKQNSIWEHNVGPRGKYYGNTPKSFFVDVVFNSQEEMTLNSVNWLTEVMNVAGVLEEFTTLTHMTIWNSYQCSSRLPMSNFTPLPTHGKRKTISEFSFNEFRDILLERTGGFLEDIFKDFAVKAGKTDNTQPWYDKRLFEDKYFVVRFEFDNIGDKSLSLHAVDIDANQSYR